MKKYRITYIMNSNVVNIDPNVDPTIYDADRYVSGTITTESTELFAYSADHAELEFYKSLCATSNNFIKILDVCEVPVNEHEMNTYRVCILYRYNDLKNTGFGYGHILVSAVSPQQAELFVYRSLCNTNKCGINVRVLNKVD